MGSSAADTGTADQVGESVVKQKTLEKCCHSAAFIAQATLVFPDGSSDLGSFDYLGRFDIGGFHCGRLLLSILLLPLS